MAVARVAVILALACGFARLNGMLDIGDGTRRVLDALVWGATGALLWIVVSTAWAQAHPVVVIHL